MMRSVRPHSTALPLLLWAITIYATQPALTQQPAGVNSNAVESEEYAVYSALLGSMYINEKVGLIAISDKTSAYSTYEGKLDETLQRVQRSLPAVAEETIGNFRARNNESYQLKSMFRLKVRQALVSEKEIQEIFGKDCGNFGEFYRRYPNSQGLMTLSRVGFNPDLTQALVYVGNQRAGLDGQGFYVLLEKNSGAWIIRQKVGMWIS